MKGYNSKTLLYCPQSLLVNLSLISDTMQWTNLDRNRNEQEERIARLLASRNYLHDSALIPIPENGDKDEIEIDSLKFFMAMLEWVEIEGTILKSYDQFLGASSPGKISFQKNELKTVDKALKEVDRIVHSIMGNFFKEFHFACGVLNSLFVTFVFANVPQHFWLLFLVEGLFMLPANLYGRIKAKPLNRVLSYLDFCWMSNTVALFFLVCLVVCASINVEFPHEVRKKLFLWTLAIACGPLLGAAIAFPFVALLFHDIDTMTGLFIHIFPPMVAYTFRWHSEEIRVAWPGVFKLDYLTEVNFFEPGRFLNTISGTGLSFYFAWLVPYSLWMLLLGIDLPRKDRVDKKGKQCTPRFDTVFHIAMRGGACLTIGKKLWGRSVSKSLEQMDTDHFERRDFLVYITFHTLSSTFSILGLGYACFISQSFHASMLVLVVFLSVFRGAKRYSYYTTDMYSRMLRKHFDLLHSIHGHKQE